MASSKRPAKAHNWPPLPTCIPIEPCFYQDIDVEIPVQFQTTVRVVYHVFLVYVAALALNCVATFANAFFANGGLGQLILAILQLGLFSPCSFLFMFRPIYKAFQNDSSMYFMVFFFVLFFLSLFTLMQALGMSAYYCGWINTFQTYKAGHTFVGLIMILPAVGFTISFAGMVYSLLIVHQLYKGSGCSIHKARQEFTNGVVSDPAVQQAATAAVQATATVAVKQAANIATQTAASNSNPFQTFPRDALRHSADTNPFL